MRLHLSVKVGEGLFGCSPAAPLHGILGGGEKIVAMFVVLA
jgi:hypothetical protein